MKIKGVFKVSFEEGGFVKTEIFLKEGEIEGDLYLKEDL